MKLKQNVADRALVEFAPDELAIMQSALTEACRGLLLDRFVVSFDEISALLDVVQTALAEIAHKPLAARVKSYAEYRNEIGRI